MNVDGKVAIVTGGAGGIGAAVARALAEAGARVVVADRDGAGAAAVAASIGDRTRAVGAEADVASTDALRTLIALAETAYGPVDVFCANAGIGGAQGLGHDDADWDAALQVNVLAHVRAARLLLPGWLASDTGGYFVTTASAAGLLTQVGAAPYSVTKHAAVAFAEWLSVTYGDRGVRVSCLCPMGVNTNMLNEGLDADDDATALGARTVAAAGEILEPEVVAARVLAAIGDETFLILPHPQVLDFFQRKANDYDRWLRGMRRLQTTITESTSS
ncbi:1-deoxy-11-beta-hydroxypentalenate dehydrogenase [Baekduia alba]|uniref:SDR family oxidoreductase n=1 Tax=Baekduia alba TaxID=2997333 RepID=UPI002340B4EA|nr:SDR family oxidoreductase [Baekduia alba]WCB92209.1 1-deoxy-11-beta-hydroxypentalenate dehydrogenase [Baekduia alba]